MVKPLAKKITRAGGFIRKWREWMESAAYRDLKPTARCLIDEFLIIHRPSRNGFLSISVENAARLLKCAPDTAGKAFHELAEHGFIALMKGEYWQERLAREWRLTFEPFKGMEPTDDWRSWAPGKPVVTLPRKFKKADPKRGGRTALNDGAACPKKTGSDD